MVKHLKKALALLAVMALVIAFPCAAFADDSYVRVFDYAQLFTQEEAQQINEQINAFIRNTGLDFVVLTADDVGGRDSLDYADVFYDQNGFGTGEDFSGMIYFIDMDNRVPTISTCGRLIDVINDQRLDSLLDTAYDCLVEGDFAGSALEVLDEAQRYAKNGVIEGQYRYDSQTGERLTREHLRLTFGEAIAAFVIAGLVALFTRLITRAGYKIKAKNIPYDPYQNGAYSITLRDDAFLHTNVVKHRRTPPPSSGGSGYSSSGRGSSVHTSSSGRSHGGGSGRKF